MMGIAKTPGTSSIQLQVPAQAATRPPTSSWPSAPMLNRPARKAKASASADPMNGTARAIEAATRSHPPTMPCTSQ